MTQLLTYFDAFAARHKPYKGGAWCYEDGLVYAGLLALHDATGEARWIDHAERMIAGQIGADGTLSGYERDEFNIDNILPGRAVLGLYKKTQTPIYLAAAEVLADQLRDHPKTKSGNYWHKKRYPWQIWLDGLYMGLPFQAEYGLVTGKDDLVENALSQMKQGLEVTFVERTGLYAHAIDESRKQLWADPQSGQNAAHWSRAIGWLVMALVDLREMVGAERFDAAGLTAPTHALLTRLAQLQGQSGFWQQVTDEPDLARNYDESSASAMFAYGFLKAVRLGLWSSPQEGEAALDALVTCMMDGSRAAQGVGFGGICWVAGLGDYNGRFRDGTAGYYVREDIVEDDPKGVAPLMAATAEAIRAGHPLAQPGASYVAPKTRSYG
ncbi:glycoside hydrolase family 88/105 protein [Celeribacter arenosi]|uniref:Glycoside hydrolase family 88 protein n=1 Tax=Celeribacter arenosi TaxID=792649 RepID=A0ABP7KJM2_9RHOB